MQVRASYVTQFMSELRQELDRVDSRAIITVFITGGAEDPDTAYRTMFDWPAWIREELIDVFCPAVEALVPDALYASAVAEARMEQVISRAKHVVGDS